MSEWSDNKAKVTSTFSELTSKLRESAEKANPRREQLTKEEEKRLAKLGEMAEKLRRRENVPNRDLKVWLREDEFAQIEADW